MNCIGIACCLAAGIGTAGPAWSQTGPVLPLPPKDAEEITAQLGAGVVGKPLPSAPITDTSAYFPLQERSPTFLVTGGRKVGTRQTLPVAKRNRPDGQTAWRVSLSPTLAGFIRQTATGDLRMPAVTDSGEDVVVVTDPANPFLLKGMQPGDTRTFEHRVAVNYLDDPSRQDYSGRMRGSFTYVGTYQVTVPAGTFSAILMRLKVEGKVGPAHTTDVAYSFFAPQVGRVAMISQEDIEAFWILHIDTTTGKILASIN